jgi:hypothetical protein
MFPCLLKYNFIGFYKKKEKLVCRFQKIVLKLHQ